MSDNLTALITRAQAQLLDDGTLFSTAALTAAFRSALTRFNESAPIWAASLVDVVDGQRVYELAAVDFSGLLDVVGVWENDADGDEDEPLAFDWYFEDNRPFVRLRDSLSSGSLLVRFSLPHTVNGLASETTSTLTADQDQVLIDGACADAIKARFLARVEKVNVSSQVLEGYRSAAASYEQAFTLGLRRYARRPAGVSQPSTARWADAWEGWAQ